MLIIITTKGRTVINLNLDGCNSSIITRVKCSARSGEDIVHLFFPHSGRNVACKTNSSDTERKKKCTKMLSFLCICLRLTGVL